MNPAYCNAYCMQLSVRNAVHLESLFGYAVYVFAAIHSFILFSSPFPSFSPLANKV